MTTPVNHKTTAAVEQYFSGHAQDYSQLFLQKRSGCNFTFRERLNLATAIARELSGNLLDCACGSGEITSAILSSGRFTRATIVDLSPRMLEVTKELLRKEPPRVRDVEIEFRCADIFQYCHQGQSGTFDLILCLGLIAHTGQLDKLLGGLKMLLSPKGKILLQSSLLDHAGTKVVRVLTSGRYRRRHGYSISYFRHRDILQTAQAAGLEAVAVERFAFAFPFGDRLSAEINYRLERLMQTWAKSHGAEALYLLQSPAPKR